MLTTDKITEIADKILRAKLGRFGYANVEVREGRDYDDQKALFLIAHMQKSGGLAPGDVMNETLAVLSDALLEENEDRFPYVSLKHEGDELPESRPREDN